MFFLPVVAGPAEAVAPPGAGSSAAGLTRRPGRWPRLAAFPAGSYRRTTIASDRHGSLLRDQDRAPFVGQLGASTPNCLAYEAGAEALPPWEELWPGPAMKLVGP